MTDFDPIEVRAGVEAENGRFAALVREFTNKYGIFLLNLMASPGAGKTSVVCRLLERLAGKYRIGVMEADMDADVDARTVASRGAEAIQLHTGGMCHLDADMTRQGLRSFDRDELDLIVLENIGNLVCPAEFDTGACINMTILSVPEGDDKPVKYPLMYEVSDILVINKIDALPVFDFDREAVEREVRKLNPDVKIFCISARTGEGVKELADYLALCVREWSSSWE